MMENLDPDSTIAALKKYKKLVSNGKGCETLINDKDNTPIPFLCLVLTNKEVRLVKGALEVVSLMAKNVDDNHLVALANTYGIIEALQAVAEKYDGKSSLSKDALELFTKLQFCKLGGGTALRDRRLNSATSITKSKPRNHRMARVTTLKLPGLGVKIQRGTVERTLLSIRGVVSIVFDIPKERFTVRIRPELSLERIGEALKKTTHIWPLVVLTDKGREVLSPLCHDESPGKGFKGKENVTSPLYPPDDDDAVSDTKVAVTPIGTIAANASTWINSASKFLTKSFYW